MFKKIDYSLIDQRRIQKLVFNDHKTYSPPPPNAVDHMVPVEKDISIGCRFYPVSKESPSILYFHGRDEVAYDHDEIATRYNKLGINLFVADYRGYGRSGGKPKFSSNASDAHVIFEYFRDNLGDSGYTGPLFVMGRSLGSLSALELSASYPEDLKGSIIESGFANAGQFLTTLGVKSSSTKLQEFEKAYTGKIHSITMPILIIHGEQDKIMPFTQAEFLYRNVRSEDRKLLRIPNADHDDIMTVGGGQYFLAIKDFVSTHE